MTGESLKERLLSERSLTVEQLNLAQSEMSGCRRHNVARRSTIGSRISGLRHKLKNIDRSLKRCGPDDKQVIHG